MTANPNENGEPKPKPQNVLAPTHIGLRLPHVSLSVFGYDINTRALQSIDYETGLPVSHDKIIITRTKRFISR
jgi:hypothetical protein